MDLTQSLEHRNSDSPPEGKQEVVLLVLLNETWLCEESPKVLREFAIVIRKHALRLEAAKQLAPTSKQAKQYRIRLVIRAWISNPEASEDDRNHK